MTAPAPIDIAALAKQAGIPTDDPGVREFAKLVAIECVRIAEWLPRDGHLSWQPRHRIDAVVDDVSGRILEAFDIEDVDASSPWVTRACAAMHAIEPRLAGDDCWDMTNAAWVDRFAARLHELEPGRDLAECEQQAQSLIASEWKWCTVEPGRAASHWHATEGQIKST